MLRRERDQVEVALLGVFAVVCAWTLGYSLWQVLRHGVTWTGVDGLFPGDQLQYLAWIRDASHHVLASDLFVIRPTAHDYLEPVVVICGALTALGIAPWLSYLLLQPLSVIALFLGIRLICHRALAEPWQRRAALALALFYGSFGLRLDEWIPFWTWGYMPGALAIAALPVALVALDEQRRSGRRPWLAPLLALATAWLHPWQGEELILIVAGAELSELARRARGRARGPARGRAAPRQARIAPAALLPSAVTVAAAALPLLYYVVLDRADPIWRAAEVNGALHWPFWLVVKPLLPLAAVAALGWFRRPRSFMDGALQSWPLATLAVYAVCQAGLGAGPLHAFAGCTIPLAILAVQGVRRVGFERVRAYRTLAIALVAAATLPASLALIRSIPDYIGPTLGWSNFIGADGQRALDALARDPRPGGVLTDYRLGADVPAVTGRHTYVGNCFWSLPDCSGRQTAAEALFDQPTAGPAARTLVGQTGARFVLAPCASAAPLALELRSIIVQTERFGCATIYVVRAPGP